MHGLVWSNMFASGPRRPALLFRCPVNAEDSGGLQKASPSGQLIRVLRGRGNSEEPKRLERRHVCTLQVNPLNLMFALHVSFEEVWPG